MYIVTRPTLTKPYFAPKSNGGKPNTAKRERARGKIIYNFVSEILQIFFFFPQWALLIEIKLILYGFLKKI